VLNSLIGRKHLPPAAPGQRPSADLAVPATRGAAVVLLVWFAVRTWLVLRSSGRAAR
jgi:hypothetical protein